MQLEAISKRTNLFNIYMKQQVYFQEINNKSYKEVWDFQEMLLKQNTDLKLEEATSNNTQNHLLFVEHFPVYTLGKNGAEANILINEEQRNNLGVEYFHINRGGDITYHGPGQIVGYPILDLSKFKTDLGWYLRSLEEVIILTLQHFGIKGDRSNGETGVWLDPDSKGKERKICAMGIKCSRWITMHGFAFNVNNDLDYFNNIIPCGIQNKQVTSLKNELGIEQNISEVKSILLNNFKQVFECEIIQQ